MIKHIVIEKTDGTIEKYKLESFKFIRKPKSIIFGTKGIFSGGEFEIVPDTNF